MIQLVETVIWKSGEAIPSDPNVFPSLNNGCEPMVASCKGLSLQGLDTKRTDPSSSLHLSGAGQRFSQVRLRRVWETQIRVNG